MVRPRPGGSARWVEADGHPSEWRYSACSGRSRVRASRLDAGRFFGLAAEQMRALSCSNLARPLPTDPQGRGPGSRTHERVGGRGPTTAAQSSTRLPRDRETRADLERWTPVFHEEVERVAVRESATVVGLVYDPRAGPSSGGPNCFRSNVRNRPTVWWDSALTTLARKPCSKGHFGHDRCPPPEGMIPCRCPRFAPRRPTVASSFEAEFPRRRGNRGSKTYLIRVREDERAGPLRELLALEAGPGT